MSYQKMWFISFPLQGIKELKAVNEVIKEAVNEVIKEGVNEVIKEGVKWQ